MKNYFFINPMAGQGAGINELKAKIESAASILGVENVIYMTKSIGDGEQQARKIAESLNGEEARFFACGGDGTLGEIVNGAVDYPNVIVGCIPNGTGNDTVRNFDNSDKFTDVLAQLEGTPETIDLIKYSGVINGRHQEKYCINMFNIGFDCNVVEMAGRLKKKPMISGSAAYLMAVLGMFLQKKCIDLKLESDGEIILDEEVLLCAIANGSFCGGGMKTSPQSSMSDGCFDINIVNNVTRTEFVKLFPKYQKGTHLSVKGIEKVVRVRKSKNLKLVPKEKNFFLCCDGEIYLAGEILFEIAPGKIRFNVPRG